MPPTTFAGVTAEDFILIDGSHRAFQSSDTTVFFTEILPALPPGTLVMALTRIMTRQLTTTETPECQAFWLLICQTVTGVVLLSSFPGAEVIGTVGWLSLAFLGLSSALAHCVFARSYAMAPVSALAPYEYTMLPWGVLAGFSCRFGDLPSWNTLVGAVVVAASGTYNVYRERVRQMEERAATRSRLRPGLVSALGGNDDWVAALVYPIFAVALAAKSEPRLAPISQMHRDYRGDTGARVALSAALRQSGRSTGRKPERAAERGQPARPAGPIRAAHGPSTRQDP